MSEIQRDYFTGLLLDHAASYQSASDELNSYIEQTCHDLHLNDEIYNFLVSEDKTFNKESLSLFKNGQIVEVDNNGQIFNITLDDLEDLSKRSVSFMYNYLPLGTIVKVDGELLMVEQRMVVRKGASSYTDYRGVPYPTGVFNDSMYVYFNREQIEEVVFKGYEGPEDEGFELALKENYISNGMFSSKYSG